MRTKTVAPIIRRPETLRRTTSSWLENSILSSPMLLGGLLAAHVVLALAIRQSSTIGLLHVAATFGAAVVWLTTEKKAAVGVYAGLYIAGAEVLWRMGRAPIPWESGKYGIILILVIAMVRNGLTKLPMVPVLYFLLMLPSTLLVIEWAAGDMFLLRKSISFNLSGPLCLAVAAAVISQIRLTPQQLRTALVMFLLPVVSVAAFAAFGLAASDAVEFNAQSSFEASGGFGPNQVSSALGAGTLAAFLLIVLGGNKRWTNFALAAVLLWVAAQCVLTFSRNGIFLAGVAGTAAGFFLLRTRKTRFMLLGFAPVLFAIFAWVVLPGLEDFTGGALSERYQDMSTTGRSALAAKDLEFFFEDPLFGIGPGMAQVRRDAMIGIGVPAHTEFTRVLGEHGVLGGIGLLLLFGLAVTRYQGARGHKARAFAVAMLLFAFGYMGANAMRLALPGILFGMAFAQLGPAVSARVAAQRRMRPAPLPRRVAPTAPPAPARGYPRSI